MTGLAGGAGNASGEDQKKLDVVSNEIFCEVLRISGRTGVIASAEEEDVPVAVEETSGRGNIQIRRTGILSGYLVRMRAASA